MTAAQYEQLLLSPGNFLKNPCQVKVIQDVQTVAKVSDC